MSRTGRIHAGKAVEPGGRYDKFLRFLRARGASGATTLEIIQATADCAPHTTKAELVAMGFNVTCTPEKSTDSGRRVFRYRLVEAAPQPPTMPAGPLQQGQLFGEVG